MNHTEGTMALAYAIRKIVRETLAEDDQVETSRCVLVALKDADPWEFKNMTEAQAFISDLKERDPNIEYSISVTNKPFSLQK